MLPIAFRAKNMILGAQKQRLVMVLTQLLRTSPKRSRTTNWGTQALRNSCQGPRGASELYSPLSSSGSQNSISAIHDTSSELHQFHRHGKLKVPQIKPPFPFLRSLLDARQSPVLLDRRLKWAMPPVKMDDILDRKGHTLIGKLHIHGCPQNGDKPREVGAS